MLVLSRTNYPVSWWAGRSESSAYQHAYDRVVETIDLRERDFLVDVECGTGEIIRRLGRGRLVGTDYNLNILLKASQNLRKHGIRSKILTEPVSKPTLTEKLRDHKVLLLLDNCLQTNLPVSFFDVAVNTFPDFSVASLNGIEPMRRNLSNHEKCNIAIFAEEQKDIQIHRSLKQDGRYIRTMYYAKRHGRKASMNAKRLRQKMFRSIRRRFLILSSTIVHSDLIGQDANLGGTSNYYRTGDLGYRILLLRKSPNFAN